MRFSIDPWDPADGVANQVLELEEAETTVSVEVEVPAAAWAPVDVPPVAVPKVVAFTDGVRRIDARAWVEGPSGSAAPAICASYAAGVVRCDSAATIVHARTHRGLFSASPDAVDVVSPGGSVVYPARPTASDRFDELSLALQRSMGELEVTLAEVACALDGCELLVVDGPLRGRQHLPLAVGYVKTHRVAYLAAGQQAVVGQLAEGQRTPVFLLESTWSRYTWYLRLPGGEGAPWAGVVRCECSEELTAAQAVVLANAVSGTLPRFASEPHKDGRAPQNLYPIAGLERDLRHRLGHQAVLYRELRRAARASG